MDKKYYFNSEVESIFGKTAILWRSHWIWAFSELKDDYLKKNTPNKIDKIIYQLNVSRCIPNVSSNFISCREIYQLYNYIE